MSQNSPKTGYSLRPAKALGSQLAFASSRLFKSGESNSWTSGTGHAIDSGLPKKRFVLSRSLSTAEQTTYSTLPRASASCPDNNILTQCPVHVNQIRSRGQRHDAVFQPLIELLSRNRNMPKTSPEADYTSLLLETVARSLIDGRNRRSARQSVRLRFLPQSTRKYGGAGRSLSSCHTSLAFEQVD